MRLYGRLCRHVGRVSLLTMISDSDDAEQFVLGPLSDDKDATRPQILFRLIPADGRRIS